MIRSKTQVITAIHDLEVLRRLAASYMAPELRDDPYCQEQLRICEERAQRLECAIRAYKKYRRQRAPLRLISNIDASVGANTLSDLLYMLRQGANLDQQTLQHRLGLNSQSGIARTEHPRCTNHRAETVREWAQACGYRHFHVFIRNSATDPLAALSHLGALAGMLRATCLEPTPGDLHFNVRSYLMSAMDVLHAQCATCYLLDDDHNRVRLVAHTGIHHPHDLGGSLTNADIPMCLLRQDFGPGYIHDLLTTQHCVFKNSEFGAREGIRAVLYAPFVRDGVTGVVFVNYRGTPESRLADVASHGDCFGEHLSFILSGRKGATALIQHLSSADDQMLDSVRQDMRSVLFQDDRPWGPYLDAVRKYVGVPTLELGIYSRDGDEIRCGGVSPGSKLKDLAASVEPLIHRVLNSGLTTRHHVELGGGSADPSYAAIGVPMIDSNRDPLGVLLAVSRAEESLGEQHHVLLRTAAQIGLRIHECRRILWDSGDGPSTKVRRQSSAWHKVIKAIDPSRSIAVSEAMTALCDAIRVTTGALVVSIWEYDRKNRVFPMSKGAFAYDCSALSDCRKHPTLVVVKPRDAFGVGTAMVNSVSADVRCFWEPAQNEEVNRGVADYFPPKLCNPLIAVPIRGTMSARPDGVLFILHRRQSSADEQPGGGRESNLRRQGQQYGELVSCVWNVLAADKGNDVKAPI